MITSLAPRPCSASADATDCGHRNAVVSGNDPQEFAGFSTGTDRLGILNSEFVSGASGGKVTHVLSVVPEVKVSKVHTAKVPVVASVQNVGGSGVTVMDDPHSSGSGDVVPIDGHSAASIGSKRRLTLIGDRLRSLSQNVNKASTSDSSSWSGVTGFLHAVVMHGAVAVTSVLTFASLNLTHSHSHNVITHLGD